MLRLHLTAATAAFLLLALLLCCALAPGVLCADDASSTGLPFSSSSSSDLPTAVSVSSASSNSSKSSPPSLVTSLPASESSSLPVAAASSASKSSASDASSAEISVLLLGNSLLTDNGLASVLLPALYEAAGVDATVDTTLVDPDPAMLIVDVDEAASHAAAESKARSQLPSLHGFSHLVMQDSPLQSFDEPELLQLYVTAVAELYKLTDASTRLLLLVPPPPCANAEQEGCRAGSGDYDDEDDEDEEDEEVQGEDDDDDVDDSEAEDGAAVYGDYYLNHTVPFYSAALKELSKKGIKGGVGLVPAGPAMLPAADAAPAALQWATALYSEDSESGLLSADGSYLVACSIFAVTTGISPVGAPVPDWMTDVDADNAARSQQAVEQQVNSALRLDKKPLLSKLTAKQWLPVTEPADLPTPKPTSSDDDDDEQVDPKPSEDDEDDDGEDEYGGDDPDGDDDGDDDGEVVIRKSGEDEGEGEVGTGMGLTMSYFTQVGVSPAVVLLIAAIVVCALWLLLSVYRRVSSLWTQKQLRKRRGYDDREVADFPKEPTQGYAFDDGL